MAEMPAEKSSAPTREIFSWAMYDWANSAFATSILTAIYSVYFTKTVVPKGGDVWWNYANAISMILVCASGPVIGAITDYTGSKKRFFLFFWTMGVAACAALFFVRTKTSAASGASTSSTRVSASSFCRSVTLR